MSTFASKFESIENLRFEPIPSRPIAVVKAVKCGYATAMLGADGCIYTDRIDKSSYYSATGGTHLDLFRCCKKLGVLSPTVIQQHIDAEAKRSLRHLRRWRANQMEGAAKDLGLSLTKAQVKAINKAKGDTRL